MTGWCGILTLESLWKFISPKQEAQLSQIAGHAGTDTEHLMKDAGLRLAEEKTRFCAAVREGGGHADREELIDDDGVRLWLGQQERS